MPATDWTTHETLIGYSFSFYSVLVFALHPLSALLRLFISSDRGLLEQQPRDDATAFIITPPRTG